METTLWIRPERQNGLNLQFDSTAVCGNGYAKEKPCWLFQTPLPCFPLFTLSNETKQESLHWIRTWYWDWGSLLQIFYVILEVSLEISIYIPHKTGLIMFHRQDTKKVCELLIHYRTCVPKRPYKYGRSFVFYCSSIILNIINLDLHCLWVTMGKIGPRLSILQEREKFVA